MGEDNKMKEGETVNGMAEKHADVMGWAEHMLEEQ